MIDMKEMKEEDIIKKALTSRLTDKEKEFLAGQEPVLRHLKEQWNEILFFVLWLKNECWGGL